MQNSLSTQIWQNSKAYPEVSCSTPCDLWHLLKCVKNVTLLLCDRTPSELCDDQICCLPLFGGTLNGKERDLSWRGGEATILPAWGSNATMPHSKSQGAQRRCDCSNMVESRAGMVPSSSVSMTIGRKRTRPAPRRPLHIRHFLCVLVAFWYSAVDAALDSTPVYSRGQRHRKGRSARAQQQQQQPTANEAQRHRRTPKRK